MKKFKQEYLNEALDRIGFKTLTKVQEEVLAIISDNKNLVVEAKTGSGKTHAFLLPILDDLDYEATGVQAVIVAPTRELARQIKEFTNELIKNAPTQIDVDLFVGGESKENDLEKLDDRQPQIVIGTPGRLYDLVIDENALKIFTAKYFVIDEADMSLDNEFIEKVDAIALIAKEAKMMIFSATISERLQPFLKKYMENPIVLKVHPEEISNLNINHYFIKTKELGRLVWLKKIIDTINPYLAIIFCNTKESANQVYDWIKSENQNACLIHGDIDFRKRKQLIKRINNLDFQYIVATDIISRGIDIIGVSHIINYELPNDFEFYIHRSGRTGRINFSGECISLYEFEDNSYLDKLESIGIRTAYKTIKNNQLMDVVTRNKREKRIRPENDLDFEAKRNVKKPKKVKPGYKKKYKEAVNKEKKKLSRKRRK
jgi:ATP-dependent RNA helicase CshB